jgi:hypothetical protein
LSPPLPRLVKLWFAITIPIVVWDAMFVLMRPASMPGGSLAWIWMPYELYLSADASYSDLQSGFVKGQSIVNLLEAACGGWALWLDRLGNPLAKLVAFAVASATLGKTVLFFLVEATGGFHGIGHNPAWKLVFLYIIPNGLWIVVPILILLRLGRELRPTA